MSLNKKSVLGFLAVFGAALSAMATDALGWTAVPMGMTGAEIRTDGDLVFAYSSQASYTVNGVAFTGLSDFRASGFSVPADKFYRDDPRSVPEGIDSTSGYGLMLSRSFWVRNGDEPITINDLEVGKAYLLQLVSRNPESYRSGKIYAPDSQNCFISPSGTDWPYGGTLIGVFVATAEQMTFTFNLSAVSAVNAIQLRKLAALQGDVDPSIGSVTATPSGSSVTLSLSGIALGTNSEGMPATSYAVHCSLTNGPVVTVLASQTGTTASFTLQDLDDGSYTCGVWLETDTPKTSATNSVSFTVNSALGDFVALKAAIESASDGATITVSKGLYLATSAITVSANNLTIVSGDGKELSVIDGQSLNRVFAINGTNCWIEGLTVKNAVKENGYGGAMDIAAKARARIVNCSFEDCSAKYGGAICCGDNSHSAFDARENYTIVSGCTFLRCSINATGDPWAGGGAIYGAVWAENSTFDACFTTPGGGLMYHADIDATSYMTVSNCVFTNHEQTNRGLVGINENRQGNGAVQLVECLVANTTLKTANDSLFHRRVILDRCVVSNNVSTAANTFMQLFRDGVSECRVRNCLIIDNKTPFDLTSVKSLENCTFVGNVGGLALNYSDSPSLPVNLVKNCVFWGNVEKTDWPYDGSYKGVPGFYWHANPTIGTALKGFAPFVHSVVENGSTNADMMDLMSSETDNASARLTASADANGKVLKNIASGDYNPVSVLVDNGVFFDWMTGARDLAGNLRAGDGKVDIGCLERRKPETVILIY